VHHYADGHGNPDLAASHNEPCGFDNQFDNGETNLFIPFVTGAVDALDFYCYWKLQDALMDCALRSENCEYAFGDTPEQHGMGNWSDGTPVRPLEITPSCANRYQRCGRGYSRKGVPEPQQRECMSCALPTTNEAAWAFTLVLMDVTGNIISAGGHYSTPHHHRSATFLQRAIYFYALRNQFSNEIVKTAKVGGGIIRRLRPASSAGRCCLSEGIFIYIKGGGVQPRGNAFLFVAHAQPVKTSRHPVGVVGKVFAAHAGGQVQYIFGTGIIHGQCFGMSRKGGIVDEHRIAPEYVHIAVRMIFFGNALAQKLNLLMGLGAQCLVKAAEGAGQSPPYRGPRW
jgi:hypothetical protein